MPKEAPASLVINGKEFSVPEMRAEFIIPPNLSSTKMKPYVAWRCDTVTQGPLTPEDLYEAYYAKRVVSLFDKQASEQEIMDSLEI
ncbi:hypothetical protein Ciccas_009489 [Cichlidogyrus casuarinus]|uniref:Uncharacterized protein n=1 Tax=Cichlidogyrus casuarinus TaxID=1844966 RepID=A0ABD2PWX1_9PLAT